MRYVQDVVVIQCRYSPDDLANRFLLLLEGDQWTLSHSQIIAIVIMTPLLRIGHFL